MSYSSGLWIAMVQLEAPLPLNCSSKVNVPFKHNVPTWPAYSPSPLTSRRPAQPAMRKAKVPVTAGSSTGPQSSHLQGIPPDYVHFQP